MALMTKPRSGSVRASRRCSPSPAGQRDCRENESWTTRAERRGMRPHHASRSKRWSDPAYRSRPVEVCKGRAVVWGPENAEPSAVDASSSLRLRAGSEPCRTLAQNRCHGAPRERNPAPGGDGREKPGEMKGHPAPEGQPVEQLVVAKDRGRRTEVLGCRYHQRWSTSRGRGADAGSPGPE